LYLMYENRTMRPSEIVVKRGGGGDEGEQWRS
jgi:hypothetical protein